MPLAGYLAARGEMSFGAAVAAGCVGSLAGAAFWYVVGRSVSRDRLCGWVEAHGTWMAMTPQDVDRAVAWFQRHGPASVFVGRLVPVARTLISLPAGFSRMPVAPFLALSSLGTTLWTGALAYAGRLLGSRFGEVEAYIGPVSTACVALAAVWYVVRVVKIRAARRSGA
jgi:membrane protein DedA with SNARE-associated domain